VDISRLTRLREVERADHEERTPRYRLPEIKYSNEKEMATAQTTSGPLRFDHRSWYPHELEHVFSRRHVHLRPHRRPPFCV